MQEKEEKHQKGAQNQRNMKHQANTKWKGHKETKKDR